MRVKGTSLAAGFAALRSSRPVQALLAQRDVPERVVVTAIWAASVACALFILFAYKDPTPPPKLVFNEMLARLLHGRLDISPAVIGSEAFTYKGATYSYFGIFCALLRLPIFIIGRPDIDMTRISMGLAAALSLGARLAAFSAALNRAEGLSRALRMAVLTAVAFGGESFQYLRPNIYQEVSLWGAALAAVFVWLAVLRVFGPDKRRSSLYAGMALVAGLALLCRVSFGLGLYAALGLMLGLEIWNARRSPFLSLRLWAPAALVLTLFMGIAGGINEARWGNPLTFVPIRYQLNLQSVMPDRVDRLVRYGEVNLRRVPYALQYYFAPVWVIRGRQGAMLFQQTQLDLFDSVELPPSSFLLSDPVVCLLAGVGLWALARRRRRIPNAPYASACMAGLSSPALLMLVVISLTFRYRMDFYPALDFGACVGAASMRTDPAQQPLWRFRLLAVLGAAASFVGLVLYAYSPLGPALDLDMRNGWYTPMLEAAHGQDPYIGHLLPDGRRLSAPVRSGPKS